MKYLVWSGLAIAALSTAFAYVFTVGEVITLHVAEPHLDAEGAAWPIRRSLTLPPTGANVLQVLRVGDQVQVDGCEDIKTDVVIRLRSDSGEIGYDGHGSFSLERCPVTLELLLSDPRRIVLSCGNMFQHSNRPCTVVAEK